MDYPTASNGKRNRFWGTLQVCPECGRCLCFGCHPEGPCLDQRDKGTPGWPVAPLVARPVEKSA